MDIVKDTVNNKVIARAVDDVKGASARAVHLEAAQQHEVFPPMVVMLAVGERPVQSTRARQGRAVLQPGGRGPSTR
jgi:hypothetical protein